LQPTQNDEKIAEITIKPKPRQVIRLGFLATPLKFRCQRCAVFCCKLGGPKLSSKDIDQLKQAGYSPDRFLDAEQASLKSKEDGSCIFLSLNSKEGLHQCMAYDYRPVLCRLYPFVFEKSGQNSYALKFIPCCKGLNTPDGETVNGKFFSKNLEKLLFDLIDSNTL